MMKLRTYLLTSVAGLMLALPAQASCFADYKAKQDDPLKLHYGVIELPDTACANKKAAASQIRTRLETEGWHLLKVQSLFDENGLEERKESAGKFFLRF